MRIAIGAGRKDVIRLVMRDGALLAGIGLAAGLLAAFGRSRLLSSFRYQVGPTDPIAFMVAPIVLAPLHFSPASAPPGEPPD